MLAGVVAVAVLTAVFAVPAIPVGAEALMATALVAFVATVGIVVAFAVWAWVMLAPMWVMATGGDTEWLQRGPLGLGELGSVELVELGVGHAHVPAEVAPQLGPVLRRALGVAGLAGPELMFLGWSAGAHLVRLVSLFRRVLGLLRAGFLRHCYCAPMSANFAGPDPLVMLTIAPSPEAI